MSAVFVDSNVLVYARDASEPRKQPRALEWLERLWQERSGRLSVQVLQEYYVTVTAKLKPGLPAALARADVRLLQAWDPLRPDATDLERAWHIEERHRLSFWDAMIVAAAVRVQADLLLTEDLQDGQLIEGVRIINPFKHPVDAL